MFAWSDWPRVSWRRLTILVSFTIEMDCLQPFPRTNEFFSFLVRPAIKLWKWFRLTPFVGLSVRHPCAVRLPFFAVRLPSVSVSSFDVSFRLVLYVVVVLVVHTEPHVVYRSCVSFSCIVLVYRSCVSFLFLLFSFLLFLFGDGVEMLMTHWSLRSFT